MSRFGKESQQIIRDNVQLSVPNNTKKSKFSVWKQFTEFCVEKSYNIEDSNIPTEKVASILKDFAFNMKKRNTEDYKKCRKNNV